jgi:hypothetical protein
MDKIAMMDDKELEKMGKNLDIDDKDDRASVITQDKLKKFNEIFGYENGPALEGEEDDQDQEEPSNHEGDEQRDEVHSLNNQ